MFIALKSNLRKKIANNILVGLVIAVCSIIMITGFSTLGGVTEAFGKMSATLKIPHLLITFPNQMYDPAEVRSWWVEYDQTEVISEARRTTEPRSVIVNGEELKNYSDSLYFSVMEEGAETDLIKSNSGSSLKAPSAGCMWIPTGYANSHKVSVGDTIQVKKGNEYIKIKVEDIVVDSYYSSGFIQPTRCWVNAGTFDELKESDLSSVSVRLKDANFIDAAWKKYTEQYDAAFSGSMLDYKGVRFANLIMPSIISGVLLLFSLIILFITLYVVSSIISMVILADFTTIGVLKSLGFTPRNIILLYILQYGGIGLIATLVGSICSIFTSRLLIGNFSASMGMDIFSVSLVIRSIILSFALIMLILLITVYFCAKKAGKIDAAQAIRFGRPKDKQQFKRKSSNLFSRVSSPPWLLAIRQSTMFRRKLLVTAICFITTVFVLVFSINIYFSITNMANQPSPWGFFVSDLTLEVEENSDVSVAEITADPRVKTCAAVQEYLHAVIPATTEQAATNVMGTVFDGDMDTFGFANVEGRNPRTDTEISIGIATAKNYHLSIGDTFLLSLHNKEVEYTICGIFQCVVGQGNGYRLQLSAARKADADFQCPQYALQLFDSSDDSVAAFKQDFENKGGVTLSASKENIMKNMGSVISGVSLGVAMMSVMFVVILIVILYNILVLCISNEKVVYGVIKVSGMTPKQIHQSIIYRTGSLFVISAVLGVPLSIVTTPKIMNVFMSSMGILQYPISFNIGYSLIAVLALFVLIILTSLIPAHFYTDISPRALLSE